MQEDLPVRLEGISLTNQADDLVKDWFEYYA